MRIKLTISVVIGTDCIGSCKSNYHMNPATTAPILHGDAFYNIKRKIYKKDFAELPFVNVVFDRMVMIYMEFVIFYLFAMHLDYCNIQRVYDQLGRNSTVYIFISCILMPHNCIRSGKSCHMYAIFTMFSSSKIYLFYIS